MVILNAGGELLLCHVTGQRHWDLPKGGMAEGESPLETALRETAEETGLALDARSLTDLGRFDYRPRKALHLFATLMPRLDVALLRCASEFSHHASGRRLPEMDGYAWFDFAEVPRRTTPRMAQVLAGRIELDRLLARLVGEPPRSRSGVSALERPCALTARRGAAPRRTAAAARSRSRARRPSRARSGRRR